MDTCGKKGEMSWKFVRRHWEYHERSYVYICAICHVIQCSMRLGCSVEYVSLCHSCNILRHAARCNKMQIRREKTWLMQFSDCWKGTLWEFMLIAVETGAPTFHGMKKRHHCQVHDSLAHREDLRFVMKELHQGIICRFCCRTIHRNRINGALHSITQLGGAMIAMFFTSSRQL